MATKFLNPPTGFTARFFGTVPSSTTTFYYWVRANYATGASTFAGPVSIAATGSFDNSNRVELTWDPQPGAISYDVLRTTTSTLPTTGSIALSVAHSASNFTDQGQATATYYTSFGAGNLRVWHATYSFAVSGGAQGAITPVDSDVIPANAIIIGGQINAVAAATSGGSATIAIGTTAGSAANSIKTATAVATFALDALINTTVTLAAAVKMSAAGQINFTVATADLTAGVIEVWVFGFLATIS